jgi:hypothetical protein
MTDNVAITQPDAALPVFPQPSVRPARVISLVSFIAGLVGIALGLVPVLGFLFPLAAIILGFIGRRRQLGAPRWMAIAGLVLGFVGFVLGALWFLGESFALVLSTP